MSTPYEQIATAVEPLAADPQTAGGYFLLMLALYGVLAGVVNVTGYYNAKSKGNAPEGYTIQRAAPIFALAFAGAIVDILVATTVGTTDASLLIGALVVGGDRLESMVRNMNTASSEAKARGLPVDQQVVEAMAVFLSESDDVVDAFRKIHRAYEQEVGPLADVEQQDPPEPVGVEEGEEGDPDYVNVKPDEAPESTPDLDGENIEMVYDYSDEDLEILGGMSPVPGTEDEDESETEDEAERPGTGE